MVDERLKICFIHDWSPDVYQELTWKDGLAAAIRILSTRHEIKFFTCGEKAWTLDHPYFPIHFVPSGEQMLQAVREYNPDVILHWADFTRPNAKVGRYLSIPQAICFAGGNIDGEMRDAFDHVFVESNSYYERLKEKKVSVSIAFGTNTKLFTPIPEQSKQFDVIFPATFCEWKRHDILAGACKGLRVCTVGFMYPVQEAHCWRVCEDSGFLVLPHVGPETLRRLYAGSRICVVPSRTDGGSQRTVLEAMSMDMPVVTCSDSDKTTEFIKTSGIGYVSEPNPEALKEAVKKAMTYGPEVYPSPRAWVLKHYSEQHYADAIEAGLKKIV